jgi:monoamine oxidase
MKADLIVAGAGVAGLTAARVAAAAGLTVTVLEARQRAGGRIFTIREAGCSVPIELGAEFVHGLPPEILGIAREARLPIIESDGEEWRREGTRLRRADRFEEMTESILRQMSTKKPDEPFDRFVQKASGSTEAKAWAAEYVEGFNAAHKERIGVHSLVQTEEAAVRIQGDRISRIQGGYGRLVDALVDRLRPEVRFHFGAAVETIRWKRGSVDVETTRGAFRARRLILTLPLGVLKAPEAVRFEPEIPKKRRAAERLEMGSVIRVALRFREQFWASGLRAAKTQDMTRLTFLYSHDESFPTWWSLYPVHAPLLVGWAAAKRGERLSGMPDEAIVGEALAALSRVTGESESDLNGLLETGHVHNWQTDPFARGAYSYVPAGAMDVPKLLAAPVEDTLFFAGEATNTEGYEGTVHGAIATGERAARQAIKAQNRVD